MNFALSRVALVFLLFFACTIFWSSEANALIASPARLEMEADPGERVSSELSLVNNEEETKTFYSSTENFEAGGESGVPKFVPSEDGLDTWINVTSQVTLEPGERKDVPFTVNTPIDAGVGGHFAAIFWSTKPPTGGDGQVSIGAKVGVLTFLRVRGDIVEKGEVIEMGTLTERKVFNNLPVDFFFRFENQGNDRSKPKGPLTIKNMFGKEVETLVANEKEGSVLPESIRKFFVSWGRDDEEADKVEDLFKKGELYPEMTFFEKVQHQAANFALGRYTADLNLEYGEEKKSAQSQFSFWVFPWQLLVLLLAAFIIVVFGGKLMVKRHNKKVIARAKRELEK